MEQSSILEYESGMQYESTWDQRMIAGRRQDQWRVDVIGGRKAGQGDPEDKEANSAWTGKHKTKGSTSTSGTRKARGRSHLLPQDQHHSKFGPTAQKQPLNPGICLAVDGDTSQSGRQLRNQQVPPVWQDQEWDELTKKLWQASATGKDVTSKIRDPSARKMVETYHDTHIRRMAERLTRQQISGMVMWWIISLWIRVIEIFGGNMEMAFIGRINTGDRMVTETMSSVRKDLARMRNRYAQLERMFRTRFGNRPRHRKMLYKIALFTEMLWVTGQSNPMSYTARALVMAWITRDVRATICTMLHGAVAITSFDWTAYNELIPAISEAAGTLSWEIMAGLKVVSAVRALAVIRWLRAEGAGRQLSSVQYNTML